MIGAELNFCRAHGALVGATRLFPTEPFDYAWTGSDMPIGCNRLRCSACGQAVRSRAGYQVGPAGFDAQRETFESGDWDALVASGVLARSDEHRLYVCACRRHEEFLELYLGEEADWQVIQPPPPWRCEGHPRFAVPGVLDGVEIGAGTDWADVAERALSQRLVAERPSAAIWKLNWATRLYRLLAHHELAARLSRAILAQLASANPTVRIEALEFFRRNPQAPGGDELARFGREHLDWFAGVPNPFAPERDLYWYLLQALAGRVEDGDREALDFARAALLQPGDKPGFLVGALQRHDAEWLNANRSAILSANLQLARLL